MALRLNNWYLNLGTKESTFSRCKKVNEQLPIKFNQYGFLQSRHLEFEEEKNETKLMNITTVKD